jgi:hypothetical protein
MNERLSVGDTPEKRYATWAAHRRVMAEAATAARTTHAR